MENQTRKETLEIVEVFKNKLLMGCRHEKTLSKMTSQIESLLMDFKLRERMKVGKQVQEQFVGHIPMPTSSIKNRLRFLFFGKL